MGHDDSACAAAVPPATLRAGVVAAGRVGVSFDGLAQASRTPALRRVVNVDGSGIDGKNIQPQTIPNGRMGRTIGLRLRSEIPDPGGE